MARNRNRGRKQRLTKDYLKDCSSAQDDVFFVSLHGRVEGALRGYDPASPSTMAFVSAEIIAILNTKMPGVASYLLNAAARSPDSIAGPLVKVGCDMAAVSITVTRVIDGSRGNMTGKINAVEDRLKKFNKKATADNGSGVECAEIYNLYLSIREQLYVYASKKSGWLMDNIVNLEDIIKADDSPLLRVPAVVQAPALPGVQAQPGVPALPGAQAQPGVPAVPGVQAQPGVPALPGVQAQPGVPAQPAVLAQPPAPVPQGRRGRPRAVQGPAQNAQGLVQPVVNPPMPLTVAVIQPNVIQQLAIAQVPPQVVPAPPTAAIQQGVIANAGLLPPAPMPPQVGRVPPTAAQPVTKTIGLVQLPAPHVHRPLVPTTVQPMVAKAAVKLTAPQLPPQVVLPVPQTDAQPVASAIGLVNRPPIQPKAPVVVARNPGVVRQPIRPAGRRPMMSSNDEDEEAPNGAAIVGLANRPNVKPNEDRDEVVEEERGRGIDRINRLLGLKPVPKNPKAGPQVHMFQSQHAMLDYEKYGHTVPVVGTGRFKVLRNATGLPEKELMELMNHIHKQRTEKLANPVATPVNQPPHPLLINPPRNRVVTVVKRGMDMLMGRGEAKKQRIDIAPTPAPLNVPARPVQVTVPVQQPRDSAPMLTQRPVTVPARPVVQDNVPIQKPTTAIVQDAPIDERMRASAGVRATHRKRSHGSDDGAGGKKSSVELIARRSSRFNMSRSSSDRANGGQKDMSVVMPKKADTVADAAASVAVRAKAHEAPHRTQLDIVTQRLAVQVREETVRRSGAGSNAAPHLSPNRAHGQQLFREEEDGQDDGQEQ